MRHSPKNSEKLFAIIRTKKFFFDGEVRTQRTPA